MQEVIAVQTATVPVLTAVEPEMELPAIDMPDDEEKERNWNKILGRMNVETNHI